VNGWIPKIHLVRIITRMEKNTAGDGDIFTSRRNFCPCCGMALRNSPTRRTQKEKLRLSKLN
jgi:hypothetical protein